MEQPIERKGMSKGCLVALIVGGVLLVIIIAGVTLICMNKDKLMQTAARMGVNLVKTEVARQTYVGLDTVRFNALIDSFAARTKTQPLSDTTYAKMATLQTILADKKVDAQEIAKFMNMIVEIYPDLAPYRPEYTPVDAVPTDSVSKGTPPTSDTVKVGDTIKVPK